jgi:hypothetical protein
MNEGDSVVVGIVGKSKSHIRIRFLYRFKALRGRFVLMSCEGRRKENHKNKTKTTQSNNYLLTCVVDRLIMEEKPESVAM